MTAEEIMKGPEYFSCDRLVGRMRKTVCAARQARAAESGPSGAVRDPRDPERGYTVDLSFCLNCEQGKNIAAGVEFHASAEKLNQAASARRDRRTGEDAHATKIARPWLYLDFTEKPEVLEAIRELSEESGDPPQTVALALLAVVTERVRKLRSGEA